MKKKNGSSKRDKDGIYVETNIHRASRNETAITIVG